MKFFDASRYASPLRKALDKKENAPRNLRFETLENRALLSVTPLDELQAAVASAEIAPAQTVETPVVDLSALAVSNATTESNADDQYEENDAYSNPAQLGELTQKITIEAIAGPNRDQDWYRVTFKHAGTADDYLLLENALGTNVNLQLYLKTTSNSEVARSQTTNSTERISLEGVPAGEYLIQVYNATNSNVYAPYALTIEPPKPETDDQYEGELGNDTSETAYDLGMAGSTSFVAKAGPNNNHDVFKFTTVAEGTEADSIKLDYSQAKNAALLFKVYDQPFHAGVSPIFDSGNVANAGKVIEFSLAGKQAGDYYVEIYNNASNSDGFARYTLSINAPKVAPAAPTGFVTDKTEDTWNYTTLSWNAVENVSYYELEVSVEDGAWTPVQTFAPETTSYKTENLAYGTAYKYRINAVRVFNDAPDASATTVLASETWTEVEFSTVDLPETPTDAKYSTLDPQDKFVTLSWKDVATTELGYVVERYYGETEGWKEIAQLDADATSYKAEGLELGTSYSYRVAAVNNAGYSEFLAFDFTTENVPAAPTGLTATVDASTAPTATLTWIDNATNETGYRVEILGVDGETWEAVETLAADATEWTTDVEMGATYQYRVVAVNAYGETASESVEVALEAASTVVTTTEDVVDPTDGEISLREAIQYAEEGATITFADDVATITLGGTELTVDKAITINGGETGVTVDANEQSGVFNVVAGTTDAPVAFVGLTITGGYTNFQGGGVFVDGYASATFTNVKITGNTANQGGGVFLHNGASAFFTNVEITENVADFSGGGVSVSGPGVSATFTNVEITGNTANQGGGVFVVNGASATFTNVEITGNVANQGGALAVVNGASATFTNATIAEAAVQTIGSTAIQLQVSTTTFNNSIIAGEIDSFGATANAYNTLSTFDAWTNANEEGVVNYVLNEGDVLFNDAENGDYALADGSVAIDKGNDAYVPETITTDLAGNPRFNGTVDLGAYESQISAAPTGLTCVGVPADLTATLTWNAENLATSYVVEQLVDGEWTQVAEVEETTWTTGTLAYGATYSYRVAAKNEHGLGEASDSVSITTETVSTVVTSAKDAVDAFDGEITLREAIQYAEAGATITFAESLKGETITLAGTELKIGKALTINGFVDETGAPQITIDADGKSRVFNVERAGTAQTPVAFYGLTITGGSANDGGGVKVFDGAANFTNVKLTGNAAQGGAAVAVALSSATFTNVEITGNTANQGGVSVSTNAVATFRNATIADNGTFEVFVRNVSTTTFYNSIVDGDVVNADGTATTNAYNTLSTFDAWTNAGEEGVVNYVLNEGDVLFAEGSYALADGSVAIDKGNDAYLDETITTDLAGNRRFNGTVDLGAYESQAPTAPTGLTATVDASTAPTATLTWIDNATNETGYRVEILGADGETWEAVETLAADATEWTTDVEMGATYNYRVVAVNAYGETASNAVEFTVGNLPAKPTDLVMSRYNLAAQTATLTWTDVADNETKYLVQSSVDGGKTWRSLPDLAADATSRKCSALTPGKTFMYRVAAANDYGRSEWAEIVFDAPNVPNAALDVAVTLNASTTPTATLTWVDVAGNETGYVVETLVDGAWVAASEETLAADAQTWTTGELALGTTYAYRVVAVNDYGRTESEAVEFTVGNVPNAPTDLTATVLNPETLTVDLTWVDVAGNETGYVVETLVDGAWVAATEETLAADAQTWTTGELALGTTYAYRVAAVNEYGQSEWATVEFATENVPARPTGLTAVVNASAEPTATSTWIADENATAYEVTLYQIVVDADGETSVVAFESQTVTEATYSTGTLDLGGTYYFEVVAKNAYGDSEVATSETFTVGTIPAQPTDLTMTNYDVVKKTAILTWVDVATNETKYLVQSSTNGGKSWNNLPNLSADATSRKCSSLTPGETFIYRVAAANDYGRSEWVEIVFNAPNVPNAPNNLTISNYDSQKMTATLSWSDVEGETKYVVQSSTNGGKSWNTLPELNADITERHCSLLTPGKAFIYRVAAVNQYGQSEWVEVSVAPLKFESVIDTTSLEGVLTWIDPLDNANGYEIETLVDDAWTNLATLEADACSFDLGTLIAETQYVYRARAVYADAEPGVWTTLQFNVDTPPVPPTAPVDLTMSNYDPQKMTATLSWSDVEGETKYVVQSSTNGGKSWNNLPELNADTTTRRCSLLTPGQTFIYRVAAVNEYGQSEWTEIVFTAPAPVSSALLTSATFAKSLDEFDFFVDEDDIDALAKRLV